jgi:hypothetical protein
MYLAADGLQVYAYATNVAVLGPEDTAHRARAALEREVPFLGGYLTWSDDSQRLEEAILSVRNGDGHLAMRRRLDEVQEQVDAASLNVDEWNVLYRLRLQVEARAAAVEAESDAKVSG